MTQLYVLYLGVLEQAVYLFVMILQLLLHGVQLSDGDHANLLHDELELVSNGAQLSVDVVLLLVHVLVEEAQMWLFGHRDLLEGSDLVFDGLHVAKEFDDEAVEREDVGFVLVRMLKVLKQALRTEQDLALAVPVGAPMGHIVMLVTGTWDPHLLYLSRHILTSDLLLSLLLLLLL